MIILSVYTASAFPECPRPPSYTRELDDSYALHMNILGYVGSTNFNKAHVVPWKTINRNIHALNPSVSLSSWTLKVGELIDDLHIIDHEWFGNKKLQEAPRKWGQYTANNNENVKNCKEYLIKIDRKEIRKMNTNNSPTLVMKNLCQCIFSAPANIKPGYKATNNIVGNHIDPLTTSKPKQEGVIECSDITERSKNIANKYGLFFLQYNNQYAGGGIVSSDQSQKVQEWPSKPFSTIQC